MTTTTAPERKKAKDMTDEDEYKMRHRDRNCKWTMRSRLEIASDDVRQSHDRLIDLLSYRTAILPRKLFHDARFNHQSTAAAKYSSGRLKMKSKKPIELMCTA